MDYRYLKDDQNYIDVYDLHTIKECLDYYWGIKDGFDKDRSKFKDFSDEKFHTEVHKCTSYAVNVLKGERYRNKAKTIRDWMDKDRLTQEKLDNAKEPKDVLCKKCHSRTKVTSKDLMHAYDNDAKVVFMFECLKCQKVQALYEDGSEWVYKPPLCPKCKADLNHVSRYSKHRLKTTYTCPKCSYKDENVDDFKKSDAERQKREEKDKKLLDEYRKDFCYDDKEGQEYILSIDRISAFVDEMKAKEVKEKDPIFQKAMKLTKLKVNELEKKLSVGIGKQGYIKLVFDKPDISQHVIIPFTVQDYNGKRNERESETNLKSLIKKVLKDTNWRLMTEGISYRLGYLSGRLKGYEREEDLIELVKTNAKRQTSTS